MHVRQHNPVPPRGGFTMIELLVVITIIAILASISFVVLADSLENARVEATRVTLGQLDIALQDRLEDFERLNLKPIAERYQLATGIPLEAATLLVKKDRFRAAFPQRIEDLYGFNGTPDDPYDPSAYGDDSPLLVAMWDVAASDWRTDSWVARNSVSDADSSELLYIALTDGSAFGPPPPGIDRIPSRHVGDTDGDGNLEFLDDWGQPLRFYNWPTRLIRPAGRLTGGSADNITVGMYSSAVGILIPDAPALPSNAAGPLDLSWDQYSHPLNQDPDDVVGALSAAIASNLLGVDETEFEEAFHTLDTYHIPLIISGGADEETGLNEPSAAGPERLAQPLATSVSDLDPLYDNITNRQR